jgi:hypothetical protein
MPRDLARTVSGNAPTVSMIYASPTCSRRVPSARSPSDFPPSAESQVLRISPGESQSSGSPRVSANIRDPRGFAVKFRTSEGNWDFVANNTPVFFREFASTQRPRKSTLTSVRDPAKFPHFIHTQKRDPATHLSGGDDSTMFWDYLSQNPEAIHQVMVRTGVERCSMRDGDLPLRSSWVIEASPPGGGICMATMATH